MRRIAHLALTTAVVATLTVGSRAAAAALPVGADHPLRAASLGAALRPDGSIAAHSGTYSAAGYRMVLGRDGAPRFVQPEVNANASWSEKFGASGTGIVQAVAVHGTHVYVGGRFVTTFGGPSGTNYNHIAMWDGSGWHTLGSGVNDAVTAIGVIGTDVFVGGSFTTAGGTAASRVAMWNGHSWSALGGGLTNVATAGNPYVNAIAVSGTVTAPKVYVGGGFDDADGQSANSVALWDGTSWSALGTGIRSGDFQGRVSALAVSGTTVYVGGSFDAAGTTHAYSLAEWTGSAWSLVGGAGVASNGFNGTVTALAASGTNLWVSGAFGTVGGTFTPQGFQTGGTAAKDVAAYDGASWSALGSGLANGALGLAYWHAHIYAAGGFGGADPVITRWNGTTWTSVGQGLDGSSNSATVVASSAGVIAAGTFTTAAGGSVVLNHVGLWTGSAWTGFGLGIAATVTALAASGADVYAAGGFTSAGYTASTSIAHFDGTTWRSMGSGLTGTSGYCATSGVGSNICTIAVDPNTGNVYVGGAFSGIDGVPAANVAVWDGSSWHSLAGGTDGMVNAIVILNGVVYAGGQFSHADGQPANDLAQWNIGSQSWSGLGSNATLTPGSAGDSRAYVTALAPVTTFTDQYLLVGGGFSAINGFPVYGVILYDITNPSYSYFPPNTGFTNPGVGPGGVVLTAYVEGSIAYLGGEFTSGGGLSASDLAAFNMSRAAGTGWSIPGTVTGTAVRALTKVGTSVYVGGSFTAINGVAAANVARYARGATHPWAGLGSGVTATDGGARVTSVTQGSAGLYLGGDIGRAGTRTPSAGIALWTATAGQW